MVLLLLHGNVDIIEGEIVQLSSKYPQIHRIYVKQKQTMYLVSVLSMTIWNGITYYIHYTPVCNHGIAEN